MEVLHWNLTKYLDKPCIHLVEVAQKYICTIVPRSHGLGIEGYFRIFLDDFEQKNGWIPWTSQRN